MNILTPKALPWAMCLLAFQAALRIQADNHYRLLLDEKTNCYFVFHLLFIIFAKLNQKDTP